MNDWASPEERFVEIPGIVEIRWVSDDPDYYVAPIDLFDEQKNGLPDYYGKKDKQTTEQAFFTCNVCECDLKSVVTLRAHCKGTQHVRKALQKKKEYRKMKKEEEARASTSAQGQDQFKTLFEHLESTSEAVVGLEFITEYLSGNNADDPLYHCILKDCQDAQGDAGFMKEHILSNRHRQSFLEIKTGSYLHHQTEIQQAVAEFTKDYRRDYREMQEVTDRRMWNDIKHQRLKTQRSPQHRQSPPKRVKPESRDDYYHHDDRDRRQDRYRERRSRSPRRSRSRGSRRTRSRSPRRSRSRSPRRFKRESDYSDYSRPREEYDRYRDYESSRDKDRHREKDRYRDYDSDKSRRGDGYRVKNEVHDDDGIEEVTRSGNFDNWRTATIKTRDDEQQSNQSLSLGASEESLTSSVEEDVSRLHRRVAKIVMDNINKYYPGADDFQPHLHKIRTPEDYSSIAKELSHELRTKIKESYQAYHDGDLSGVKVTPDNIAFIEQEVERYFEHIPVIRERRY